jgi:outer membrane protein OmpA-like peptidoglycan-associated protein
MKQVLAPIGYLPKLSLPSLLLLCCATACGGAIKFEDRSAIKVSGTPPPPPAPVQARVELRDDRIVINEKVQFAYNDSTISSASFSLLDEVADVIKKNPQIKKIEIGGHASTEGSADHNMLLSDRRAKAVQTHLTTKDGVSADRLTAKGYGVTRPLTTPDDTEEKREVNRRVEFLITEQDVTKRRVEIDPKTNEEKVLETIKEPAKEGN